MLLSGANNLEVLTDVPFHFSIIFPLTRNLYASMLTSVIICVLSALIDNAVAQSASSSYSESSVPTGVAIAGG